jgi:hypothetical protein
MFPYNQPYYGQIHPYMKTTTHRYPNGYPAPLYPPPYAPVPRPQSDPYPPNEVNRFRTSATTFLKLSEQVKILLEKIESDERFAKKLRGAAQKNQKEDIDRLVRSTGMQALFEASYSPDGMKIELCPSNENECAKMVIHLCW